MKRMKGKTKEDLRGVHGVEINSLTWSRKRSLNTHPLKRHMRFDNMTQQTEKKNGAW